MVKKKSNKKQSSKALLPRSSEQMMRDISRMLNDRDFDSVDEMNKFLQDNLVNGQPIPSQPRSALDHAQELIYQAHEARSKAAMIKLVRKALDISPDCADGYVMLAEYNIKTLAEAWALYEAGVRAGERAIGDEFKALEGHFWGVLETRPYMRARMGLAVTLWSLGYLQEAADHMSEMLKLNPNDNQGVRQLLITLLLQLGDDKRLNKLLNQYPDDWSAYWKYGQALYAFKQKGTGGKADELLSDAISYNPHVPPYLLGNKKQPKRNTVAYYSPGDENEALDYVVEGILAWSAIEGALDWLKTIFTDFKKSDPSN